MDGRVGTQGLCLNVTRQRPGAGRSGQTGMSTPDLKAVVAEESLVDRKIAR
jgi:hypothetical protein